MGGWPRIRLAELAAADCGTVTRALRTLAAQGLVVVCADPKHGRRTAVQLTVEGVALHGRLARFVHRRNHWLKNNFSREEMDTLLDLLGRPDVLSRELPTDPEKPEHAGESGCRPLGRSEAPAQDCSGLGPTQPRTDRNVTRKIAGKPLFVSSNRFTSLPGAASR